MTANADLIREARKLDAEAPVHLTGYATMNSLATAAWAVRARTLLPQLADALELAIARLSPDHPAYVRQMMEQRDVERARREKAEAMLREIAEAARRYFEQANDG